MSNFKSTPSFIVWVDSDRGISKYSHPALTTLKKVVCVCVHANAICVSVREG